MIGRLVDHGTYILSAAVLLLAVTSVPMRLQIAGRPVPGSDSWMSASPFSKGCRGGRLQFSTALLFRAADSPAADFKDELDADVEDESTAASPPTSDFLEAAFAPSLGPRAESVRYVLAPAARPLRC